MQLKQYGITLRRVEARDIEIIRKFRNSALIKNNMIFRKHISKKEQLNWFESIKNNKNSIYYIIIHKKKKVGLINVKDIDSENGSESGLFMFYDEYLKTTIPVLASIIMLKIGFLSNTWNENSYIKVLKSNKLAINFNKSLGYTIDKDFNNSTYLIMKITQQSFNNSIKRILNAIDILKINSNLTFILNKNDFELGLNIYYNEYVKVLNNFIIKKTEKQNYLELIINI